MDISEIKALNDEQIKEELEKARREVFDLRFRAVTRQLDNTSESRLVRKTVARLLTVQRERELLTIESRGENGS
ncbi:MAG: 50S ribosomal protein L29 [Dehalococcoidia bacterium]